MNKALILVVEDDRPIRNLIVTTLKTHDYKYITAENGSSAILEASSHKPEIILLDLGLPDMEGVDVIKKVRTWSNVPIIVISARSEDVDKIEALDAGADDYITKPFSVDELLARIRVTQRRLALIQSGEEQEQAVFVNGELKIDYTAGSTYLKDKELQVILKEEANDNIETGKVIRYSPQQAKAGDTIELVVSTGPKTAQGQVPKLIGRDEVTADALLKAAGFENGYCDLRL